MIPHKTNKISWNVSVWNFAFRSLMVYFVDFFAFSTFESWLQNFGLIQTDSKFQTWQWQNMKDQYHSYLLKTTFSKSITYKKGPVLFFHWNAKFNLDKPHFNDKSICLVLTIKFSFWRKSFLVRLNSIFFSITKSKLHQYDQHFQGGWLYPLNNTLIDLQVPRVQGRVGFPVNGRTAGPLPYPRSRQQDRQTW
jgi:hypothetical protein